MPAFNTWDLGFVVVGGILLTVAMMNAHFVEASFVMVIGAFFSFLGLYGSVLSMLKMLGLDFSRIGKIKVT